MPKAGNVVKKGQLVDIVPPKKFSWAKCGTWLVKGIFMNKGEYPELPKGPVARLHYPFRDNWLLPVKSLRPSFATSFRPGPDMP